MKKIIIYTLILFLLGFFIYISDYDLSVLKDMKISDILIMSGILFLSFIVNLVSVKVLFRMMNVKETWTDTALLSFSVNLLNYLPAKGGLLSLGTFLKVKRNVPVHKYAFVNIFNYLLVTAVTLISGVILVFYRKEDLFYVNFDRSNIFLFLLFVIILTGSIIFTISENKKNRIAEYYKLFAGNMKIIKEKPADSVNLLILVIAGLLIFSIRMYFSFGIAGTDLNISDALTIGVIANLSFFISFTPGGLGIKEGMIAGAAYFMFGDPAAGVMASLIDRTVNMLWTVIFGTVSMKKLDSKYFSKK